MEGVKHARSVYIWSTAEKVQAGFHLTDSKDASAKALLRWF